MFDLPKSTLFSPQSRAEGMSQIPYYRKALLEHGVAKIQCDFGGDMEDKSGLLLDIVSALGKADSHSETEGMFLARFRLAQS